MADGIRIDKFLWHARLAKTRSLAARLCEAGLVELGSGKVSRPAQAVKIGDILTVSHGGWRRCIEVLGLGVRRGPAAEARLLYRDAADPVRLSTTDPGWVPLLGDEDDYD